MDAQAFIEKSKPFMQWMADWYASLGAIDLEQLTGAPNKVAILSVGLIKAFTEQGLLASPRIAATIKPITALMQAAWGTGVRHIVLVQDAHPADAVEFAQWGPHAVAGTPEAETVEAVTALPFFDQIETFEKNSISPAMDTELDEWLDTHPEIATFVVTGNCTNMGIYQLALHLRTRANARQLGGMRVIIPENMVQTIDLSLAFAQEHDLLPHNGDFMHLVFLYNMMQNGVTVVKDITF